MPAALLIWYTNRPRLVHCNAEENLVRSHRSRLTHRNLPHRARRRSDHSRARSQVLDLQSYRCRASGIVHDAYADVTHTVAPIQTGYRVTRHSHLRLVASGPQRHRAHPLRRRALACRRLARASRGSTFLPAGGFLVSHTSIAYLLSLSRAVLQLCRKKAS
jgi:hypothetical protein